MFMSERSILQPSFHSFSFSKTAIFLFSPREKLSGHTRQKSAPEPQRQSSPDIHPTGTSRESRSIRKSPNKRYLPEAPDSWQEEKSQPASVPDCLHPFPSLPDSVSGGR